jgi:hypothetical protein
MDLRGKHKVLTGSPDFLFVRLAQQPQQVLIQKIWKLQYVRNDELLYVMSSGLNFCCTEGADIEEEFIGGWVAGYWLQLHVIPTQGAPC